MDLIFSDIHADIGGLKTILNTVNDSEFTSKYGNFSRILNLGDVLERGTNPKLVLETLEELSKNYTIESVMGNHDEAVFYGRKISDNSFESIDAHNALKPDDMRFFTENKDGTYGRQQFIDSKRKIVCVHGGPLDAQKIIPNDSIDDSWLYQKTWQRLTEEEFGYFSHFGYHYTAKSAFEESSNHFDNSIIFCGHQHMEGAIEKDGKIISNLFPETKMKIEKFSEFTLEKKEIPIEQGKSYIIRVGLGGPEGYYGVGMSRPHFGLADYDAGTIILYSIITSD